MIISRGGGARRRDHHPPLVAPFVVVAVLLRWHTVVVDSIIVAQTSLQFRDAAILILENNIIASVACRSVVGLAARTTKGAQKKEFKFLTKIILSFLQ